MTPAARQQLRLRPERCDGCGRCENACPEHALKVGTGYLFVDWSRCDGCAACVDVCDRGAIEPMSVPQRRAPRVAPPRVGPPAAAGPPSVSRPAEAPGAAAPAYLRAVLAGPDGPTPRAHDDPGDWSLVEIGALLVVTMSLLLAKDAVLSVEAVRAMPLEVAVWVRAFVLAAYYAVEVGFLLWLTRREGGSAVVRLRLGRPAERAPGGWVRAAGAVTALLVLTRLAATAYAAAARGLGWEPQGLGQTEFVRLFGSSASGLLISAALVVLVAPVVEEAVFRGAVLGALGRYLPRWAAVVVSALLFAALHLDAWMFVPTLMLGLVLGWLATRRTTLWPAIAMHVLYNATAVAAAFVVVGKGVPPA